MTIFSTAPFRKKSTSSAAKTMPSVTVETRALGRDPDAHAPSGSPILSRVNHAASEYDLRCQWRSPDRPEWRPRL